MSSSDPDSPPVVLPPSDDDNPVVHDVLIENRLDHLGGNSAG